MTSKLRSLPAAARTLAGVAMTVAPFVAAGCQPGLTVIDADAPVRLGQPHVEQWELQPNPVQLSAGKYVITRRTSSTAPASK